MDSWSLEISLVTRRLFKDPAITWGPGGRTKIRRSSRNPEAVWEPGDSLIDSEIVIGNRRLCENTGFSLRSGDPGTHPAPAEGERAVIWARQLPVDRLQVNFLVRDMAGGVANDPFTAYQEAVKVMSAKKGSSSRSASGDEERDPKATRSAQQSADVARSAGSVAVTLSYLNLNVFPQDGTVLSIGDPSEVVQVLQGGLLRRAARELEIRDLKDKVKDLEKVAEASSADALATSQKNQ
ncbi:hypothetical protein F2Q69_00058466 [Brassica cretica]|uniref:Uncharacterized protein n=1 Tax=Brassica cretica TaxID=69181 RepID=A0A8S9RMQ4_BRACR|nr:hypothetical protein F2Q69_00058466 [Brassica cretica]